VGAAIVDGIERDRAVITADVQTRLLARGAGLLGGVLNRSFDRTVRKVRGESG
jgi:hypothetical protein